MRLWVNAVTSDADRAVVCKWLKGVTVCGELAMSDTERATVPTGYVCVG